MVNLNFKLCPALLAKLEIFSRMVVVVAVPGTEKTGSGPTRFGSYPPDHKAAHEDNAMSFRHRAPRKPRR